MADFPPRPNENEDPWYSKREVYDSFLEAEVQARFRGSLGILPENTDLDSLRETHQQGLWALNPSMNYLNLPEDRGTQHASLLNFRGTRGSVQFYLNYNKVQYRTSPGSIWGGWRELVTTEMLDTINEPKVLSRDTDLDDLEPGTYVVHYNSIAREIGLPNRVGTLKVIQITPTINLQKFETNQGVILSSGVIQPYEIWVRGMDLDRKYYPNFEKVLPQEDSLDSRLGVSTTVRATRAKASYSQDLTYYSKNADVLDRPASTTKIMTSYVARRYISNTMLNTPITVLETDLNPGGSGSDTPLKVGDIVTIRDLFYMTMLPSHNQAASILARVVGEDIVGSGTPYNRFVTRMQTMAIDLGYDGAVFTNPTGLGSDNQMTVSYLEDLMYKVSDDSFLVDVMGTQYYSVDVKGPDERDLGINHTVDPDGVVKFPEMVAAKSGTLGSHACLVMLFRKSNGSYGVGALMGSNSANRYKDMRQIINYALEGRDRQYLVNPG